MWLAVMGKGKHNKFTAERCNNVVSFDFSRIRYPLNGYYKLICYKVAERRRWSLRRSDGKQCFQVRRDPWDTSPCRAFAQLTYLHMPGASGALLSWFVFFLLCAHLSRWLFCFVYWLGIKGQITNLDVCMCGGLVCSVCGELAVCLVLFLVLLVI